MRLKLDVPSDGRVRARQRVTLRGTVRRRRRGARRGRGRGGRRRPVLAEVELRAGRQRDRRHRDRAGRRAATDAVRVLRDMRVEVPRLVGDEVDAAKTELGESDLRAVEARGGGLAGPPDSRPRPRLRDAADRGHAGRAALASRA